MKKVYKKINKKGQQPYISRMRGGETPEGSVMKLSTLVELLDVMNYAKFHLYRLHGFLR
jgi:hypothetical protein